MFLCADLGVKPEPLRTITVHYQLAELLKADKKAIFIAASRAQAATDFATARQASAL